MCLSAFSIVVFPNPMIDFNLNSFATLDTIGDTDELIEAAVDIVELHSSFWGDDYISHCPSNGLDPEHQ